MTLVRTLAPFILSILIVLSGCFHDEPPTPQAQGSCPAAQELFDYASNLHRDAQEKIHFGSTWEARYKLSYYRKPHYYQYLQLFVAGPLDDRVVGASNYEGTTEFTFTMPVGPTPLSCEEVTQYQQEFGEGVELAMQKELIGFEYFFRFMDAFPIDGIPITATGSHQSWQAPSFVTDRIIESPIMCSYDNPCPQDRVDELGCSVPPVMHTVYAHVGISWYPEEDALFWTSIDDYIPIGTPSTQVERSGNPDLEVVLGDPNDICTFYNPVCLGTTTQDIPCGIGYQRFDRNFSGAPDIILKPLQVQEYRTTNSYGDVRTRLLELECIDGCECVVDTDCDDGRVCTRDSCVAGNCNNVPDDLIEPPQVPDDCLSCENGEVVSMREIAERECEAGKSTTMDICSSRSNNWIVHWVKDFAGVEEQAHFCRAGTVPAESELTICNGAGVCETGSPVTTREAHIDRSCQNADGLSIQLVCNVLCTVCQ